jgi:hypothetical protein
MYVHAKKCQVNITVIKKKGINFYEKLQKKT